MQSMAGWMVSNARQRKKKALLDLMITMDGEMPVDNPRDLHSVLLLCSLVLFGSVLTDCRHLNNVKVPIISIEDYYAQLASFVFLLFCPIEYSFLP